MTAKRKIGTQGLEVSALGLGCLGMSQSYGAADERESLATLDRALELGVTPLRYRGGLRPVQERRVARPRAQGPARTGSDRDQVRLAF